jgi:tRNA/tmRNA/rRNA uracil-C5-methylase (TrmA/RlmC/RlmD family)
MGESAIISGQLSQLENRQQQLDRLEQQISVLNRISRTQEQMQEIEKQTAEKQKALEDLLKNVDANTAEMVRKLGDAAKDPIDQLRESGGFNTRQQAQPILPAQKPLPLPPIFGG